jgi:hypothetical protein
MRFFLLLALAGCTRPADPIHCDPGDVLCLRVHDLGDPRAQASPSDLALTFNPAFDLSSTVDLGSAPTSAADLSSTTPVTTGNSLGAACGSCAAGEVCALSHGVRDVNICRQPCQIDGDCQQATFPGGLAPFCEGATAMAQGSCSLSCNPVNATVGANGCGAGLACYAISDRTRPSGTVIISDCIPPGSGASGAFCNETTDCAPGLLCVNVLLSQCYPVCNLADGICPAGTTCTQFLTVSSQFGFCT